jgi:cytidylate kinase
VGVDRVKRLILLDAASKLVVEARASWMAQKAPQVHVKHCFSQRSDRICSYLGGMTRRAEMASKQRDNADRAKEWRTKKPVPKTAINTLVAGVFRLFNFPPKF